MKFKRVLLKLSGEALMGNKSHGIDPERLFQYASDIKEAVEKGIEVAIVIGGGNIYRGLGESNKGLDRVQGDYMGMLATIINGLAVQSALLKIGVETEVLSGLKIDPICEEMSRRRAASLLSAGKVVIISGGTGNPFFTTDTAAALRGVEIQADALLKGTRVDGIYDCDPEKNANAVRYDTITFDEAYSKGLKIMDLTAFTLCQENNLPIIVFDMNKPGNLLKLLENTKLGTLVTNK